jgi:hypothetical protein
VNEVEVGTTYPPDTRSVLANVAFGGFTIITTDPVVAETPRLEAFKAFIVTVPAGIVIGIVALDSVTVSLPPAAPIVVPENPEFEDVMRLVPPSRVKRALPLGSGRVVPPKRTVRVG